MTDHATIKVTFKDDAPIKINSKDELNLILKKIRRNTLPSDYLVGADFSGGDFSEVDFSGIDLSKSNFTKANLTRSNLSFANLSWASFFKSNISWASLFKSNLSWASLTEADIAWTSLSGANLSWTSLSGADLAWANLSEANLYRANLAWANLAEANLEGAKIRCVLFRNTYVKDTIFPEGFENSPEFLETRILPEGDIIGWKKCLDDVLVKLRIPADAPRSNAFSKECRAAYADVLEVIGGEKGVSFYDRKTTYEVGKRVHADEFDPDWRNECSSGIHFFLAQYEAEAYRL